MNFSDIFRGFYSLFRNTFEWLLRFISIERLTRKYIFPRKILFPRMFEGENTTVQTIST